MGKGEDAGKYNTWEEGRMLGSTSFDELNENQVWG
jgi:hypothetical protein